MEIKVETKPQIGENYPQDIELKSTIMDKSTVKNTQITTTENECQNILKDNGELKSKTISSSSNLNSETKSEQNCVSSSKPLSFSIERMLNYTPSNRKSSEKRNYTPNNNLSNPVPLQPNLAEHETKKSMSSDNEEVEVDEDEIEDVENISNSDRFTPHSRTSTIPNTFDQNAVVPLGLNLNPRPMWPTLFSYIGNQWPECNRDRFGVIRRVGHPYQNRSPPKRKKPRTAFTRQQVMELEKRFSRQKYLASAERSTLAKGLNMSDSQVKTWFQNRRTKWRRQTAEEREMERQAAQKFLMSIQREEGQSLYSPLCSPPSSAHFSAGLSRGMDVRYIEQS